MKTIVINWLPEFFRAAPGQLSDEGLIVAFSIWGLLFVIFGLIIGSLCLRKARSAVISLERENEKGFNRLAIYRATVEKQAESSFLKN